MKLLDKLEALTNSGYSVSFEPIPYDRGARIRVRFLSYNKMYQVPDWSYIRKEEYVVNILNELVANIKHSMETIQIIKEENNHE